MTDRLNGLTVVLNREIREDDAEAIIHAIRMIKGVQSVEGVVSGSCCHNAKRQAEHAMKEKFRDFIHEQL